MTLPTLFNTARAVAHTVYAGLCVLFAELYWLCIPDALYRRQQKNFKRSIERARTRLLANADVILQSELDVLEAEFATLTAQFATKRAQHLEALRRRCAIA